MRTDFQEYIKQILAIEERVKLELMNEGPITDAPKAYGPYGIKWLWSNRMLSRQVTVQCVVSDIENKVQGAWIELEHKRDSFPRPMDSWAKRVYGEILVYVSPGRGQAVIFATRKLKAAFANAWRDYPESEVEVHGGKVKGISIPWDTFCKQGTVVTVQ